ncbi:uncharacterized protein [Nicotiana sylvestris]|uniref:uncharacterized protein n=1 Tax=Nicotiana sylvestris TaxID=4096 RepID=UPI00388CB82A
MASNENASAIHLFHSVLNLDKNEVREKEVKDFIWWNIICRFGLPKKIVCDNGPQFIGTQITEFFQSWQTKRITSTPYHSVGNGQAESTNKVIINNLKKRLEESKGNWPEVLPGVLWAYCTTAKISTGETPFSLVHGAEALIPVEIRELSTRFTRATEESNDDEMRVNLDLLEGRREVALTRMVAQKQVIERYYNRKARLRFFKIGDFMLKKELKLVHQQQRAQMGLKELRYLYQLQYSRKLRSCEKENLEFAEPSQYFH